MTLTEALQAWSQHGPIGLAIVLIMLLIVPTFGLLVWIIRGNRADRKEEIQRSDERFDKMIQAHTHSGESVVRAIGVSFSAMNDKLGDVNDNVNAVHTRLDNFIGGRTGARTSEEDRK